MKPIQELNIQLEFPQTIVITHHYNPDADAVGSSLALGHFFQKKGHKVYVISPNSLPAFLHWMPGSSDILIYETNPDKCNQAINEASILFALDYNHFSRTKCMEQSLAACTAIKVMIDHHLFPDTSFDYGISLPEKSSTCEMIYDYLLAINGEVDIDQNIAKCLYAGTMTDTGSFKYSSTSSSTHRMIARLMDTGIVASKIHEAIFDNYEENRLRFLGHVLSEKMILFPEFHAALIPISKEDLNRYNISSGDTEGIVNYPLSMRNIIFSTFISERDNEIRMSFRSKGEMNVNEFARKWFSGGGHANAAGGKSILSLTDTIDLFKKALNENESQLKTCYEASLLV